MSTAPSQEVSSDRPRLSRAARLLRVLGALEGLSYVILLGIAMPLKYLYGMPLAVRITGAAHGILFVAYCGTLHVAFDAGMRGRDVAKGFIASLVPLGFLGFDPILRGVIAESASDAASVEAAAGPDVSLID